MIYICKYISLWYNVIARKNFLYIGGNMRKKLVRNLIVIVSVLIIGGIIGLIYKKHSIDKRYEVIRTEIEKEAIRYLKISHPHCSTGSSSFAINENTLLVQLAMDKNKLLDVDGKSYCKVRVEVICVAENELDTDVYIKCKDYEDKNYSNWEERHLFVGTILEINDNSIVVEPVEGSYERKSSDKIIIEKITTDDYVIGDKIKITYNGLINESYPVQINATEIELIK